MGTAALNPAGMPIPVGYMIVFSLSKKTAKKGDAGDLAKTMANYVMCRNDITKFINDRDTLELAIGLSIRKSGAFMVKCSSETTAKALMNYALKTTRDREVHFNLWTTFPIIGGMQHGPRT